MRKVNINFAIKMLCNESFEITVKVYLFMRTQVLRGQPTNLNNTMIRKKCLRTKPVIQLRGKSHVFKCRYNALTLKSDVMP